MVPRDARTRGQRVDEAVLAVRPPHRDLPDIRFLDWPEVEEFAAAPPDPYNSQGQLHGSRLPAGRAARGIHAAPVPRPPPHLRRADAPDGAHPKLLQSQMGNASISITLDLYGHLYPDVGADTARALERLIRSSRGKPAEEEPKMDGLA